MDIILTRHSYSPTETMGTMRLMDGRLLHTIERPWIHDPVAGSKPYESCIPDGPYDLVPHYGEDWTETWALVNPALKVWHHEKDMDGPGRFACLLHAANWVENVVGCIGPGLARTVFGDRGELGVTSSQAAMNILRNTLHPGARGHRIIIQPHPGARISLDG